MKLVALVIVALLVLPGWSFAVAMSAPGNLSPSEKAVEWLRDHGMGSVVNGVQHWWYSTHPPPQGRQPHPPDRRRLAAGLVAGALGADVDDGRRTPAGPTTSCRRPPHPVPNEGRWLAVGPRIDGIPTMYETQVRPDAVHTSVLDGLVWMDPKLLRFALHPGLEEPGGKWTQPPDVPMAERLALVAAFNSGFPIHDAPGRLLPRRHDPGAARRRRRVARHRPRRLGDGGAVGARRPHEPATSWPCARTCA